MRDIDKCKVYEPEIKRLTKTNSSIINGKVIYIVKKDWTGKSSPFFCAYDYQSKVFIHFDKDKNSLIGYLFDKLGTDAIDKLSEKIDSEIGGLFD